MQLNLTTADIEGPELLEDYVRRVLHSALGPHAPRVRAARVRLVDANGPERGGLDKRCWITLRLETGPDVVAESVHVDARGAVCLSAGEAARMVARRARTEQAQQRRFGTLMTGRSPLTVGGEQ